ncbi:hypothetical protein [Paenibacillus sp. QZ-Y1]|uniref:hypothetical protein n=1 Tax=Paenibacillus sp. QZ-Y1 TaxID=3414511 RepID=UPI003F7ADA9D
MKKFTVLLMVFILSLMVSSVTMASGTEQEPKQATMKVDRVYYMKGSGYYVTHTTKDQEGHFWVLQVTDIAVPKEDKSFTEVLRKQYQGKQVVVTYVEPLDDEEVEFWGVKVK